MSVYKRPDSRYWHLYLETAPRGNRRVKTSILIGETATQKVDSRRRAETLYAQRMDALATTIHRLPPAEPARPAAAERFETFATWYDENHIVHHAGRERERGILKRLRLFFDPYPLDQITKALVIGWRTRRRATPITVENYGENVGAPAMWRQLHAVLKARGPLSLAEIHATFGASTRAVFDSGISAHKEYFQRVKRGVWAAVGRPPRAKAHTFPPPSARTVNREVDLLQQILTAALEAGKLGERETSPIYGLPNLPIVEPIRRTMSEAEEAKVLAELTDDDRAIVLVGTDTLMRMINILDLRWTDDHGPTIDIRDPKNGKSSTVPVSTRLRAALDALPREGAYIFPRRRKAESDESRRAGVANALKRACERAGVPYGRAAGGLTFHWATRRTGATRMIRRGGEKAVRVTQQIGGWKTANVLLGIYQETVTEEMIAAVESVGPQRGESPAPLATKPRPTVHAPLTTQAKVVKFARK